MRAIGLSLGGLGLWRCRWVGRDSGGGLHRRAIATPRPSYPAHAGYPVRRPPVDSIIDISGILDHPHTRVMTTENAALFPYPFTAPAVSPWIKCRCRKLNSTATGTVLRMTPAESGPHCTSY